MLDVPLNRLTLADLTQFVEEGVEEGVRLEFKETLPVRDVPTTGSSSRLDRWYADQGDIGTEAKAKITKELVAFANTDGGRLILGIKETDDDPPRAASLSEHPIPKCKLLAERLARSIRDRTDPPIPIIDYIAIEVTSDGSGYVVLETPRSWAAPHRSDHDKQCYVRRRSNSEPMTMREIRQLMLESFDQQRLLEQRLSRSREQFAAWVGNMPPAAAPLKLRVGASPATPIFVDNLVRRPDARLCGGSIWASLKSDGQGWFECYGPQLYQPRPSLRAVEERDDDRLARLTADGAIDIWTLQRTAGGQGDTPVFYPGWLMSLLVNALISIARVRHAAASDLVDYALQLDIQPIAPRTTVAGYGSAPYPSHGEILKPGIAFPTYTVGPPTEWPALVKQVEDDFWNAIGCAWDSSFSVDWKRAFSDRGVNWLDPPNMAP